MATPAEAVLKIRDLGVRFQMPAGEVEAVRGLTLDVAPGECVGVVGESGAGKSQAFLSLLGLLPSNARITGSATFEGIELIGRSSRELDRLRGAGIAMIFQDPLTALTPHLSVGDQIGESIVMHRGASWTDARARALTLLEQAQVTDSKRRLSQYPHELSGGMRQRVMIAIALACEPRLIIADEPTTALDVTIQAQILALLAELKRERGMSMVLITHDLGIVAGMAERVAVMHAGQVVELDRVERILKSPSHAYTQALLQAVPRLDSAIMPAAVAAVSRAALPDASTALLSGAANGSTAAESLAERATPLLSLSGLRVQFKLRAGFLQPRPIVKAVDDASLTLERGEALGIVGESGSGKSTLARAILRLVPETSGTVLWLGKPLPSRTQRELRSARRDLQLVFQDPLASLDPRMTVASIVAEPLQVHRPALDAASAQRAVAEMLLRVGLGKNLMTRYPHELSGGQAQRVGIARAMILEPKLLICDEAVSSLDVSVQAQVIALLHDLKREYRTAILFISHNLAVVRQLCERVLVLYLGRMMEQGATFDLYSNPRHPYTRGLLEAVPVPDPDVQPGRLTRTLPGELPSPVAPPSGCVFRTRCPHAQPQCAQHVPPWEAVAPGHDIACLRWRELSLRSDTAFGGPKLA